MVMKTVADVIRPNTRVRALAYDVILVLSVSVVLSLCSTWRIGWPVPITLQTFVVLFSAMLLGAKRAIASMGLFILYGLTGMPWYLAGSLLGPTGGYIVGFLAAAAVVGQLAASGMDRKYHTMAAAMILGNVIIYLFGVIWLSFFVKDNLFGVGVLPFIPGDLIKIVAATALLPTGWKLLEKIKK